MHLIMAADIKQSDFLFRDEERKSNAVLMGEA